MGVDSRDAIGISLQVLATFMAALAYVLQKQAHVETTSRGGVKSNVFANKKWITGFALMATVAVIDIYSFSLLDQTKQAAFGAVTLVWNTILASIILKESFTVLDLLSVVIIMTGTITGLSNASPESADFTFREIVGLLDDTLVYAYSTCICIFIAIASYFVERTSKKSRATWSPKESRAIAVLSPCLGGMFMGFTGYGAKALATVIFDGEWDEFKNPELYGYIALSGVAVSMQVRYLNKGLEFFDALAVVPIFQSSIIFSNALAGIVYYHDMRTAPAWKLLMFAFGGFLCITGICLLLLKTKKPKGLGHAIPDVNNLSGGSSGTGSASSSPIRTGSSMGTSSLSLTIDAGNNKSSSSSGSSGGNNNNSGSSSKLGFGGPTPGTPLLLSVKKQPVLGAASASSSSSTGSISGSGGGSGSASRKPSATRDEGESIKLSSADSLGGEIIGSSNNEGTSGLTTGSDTPSAPGFSSSSSSGAGATTIMDDHHSSSSSSSSSHNSHSSNNHSNSEDAHNRARSMTSRRILRDLAGLDPKLTATVLDVAEDWPEPPLRTVDETGGGAMSPVITRTTSNSGSNSEGVVITERWWNMEVGAAARLVLRRVQGSRYSTI